MLCENCKSNKATFFYKQTKNGVTTEKNLCSECAKSQGLTADIGGFHTFDDMYGDNFFGGILGSLFEQRPSVSSLSACPFCGTRLGELLNSGTAGCAKCYETFASALSPTIAKIHGKVAHCGKAPKGAPKKQLSLEDKIAILKDELEAVIERQEYERAAELRDEIRALEKGEKGE